MTEKQINLVAEYTGDGVPTGNVKIDGKLFTGLTGLPGIQPFSAGSSAKKSWISIPATATDSAPVGTGTTITIRWYHTSKTTHTL